MGMMPSACCTQRGRGGVGTAPAGSGSPREPASCTLAATGSRPSSHLLGSLPQPPGLLGLGCSPLTPGQGRRPGLPQAALGPTYECGLHATRLQLGPLSIRCTARPPCPFSPRLPGRPAELTSKSRFTGSPRPAGDTRGGRSAGVGVPGETQAASPPLPAAAGTVQPSGARAGRKRLDGKPLPAAALRARGPRPAPLPLAHVAAHGAPAAGRQQRAEPVRLLGDRGAGRGAPRARLALGRRARQLGPRHPAGAHGGGRRERTAAGGRRQAGAAPGATILAPPLALPAPLPQWNGPGGEPGKRGDAPPHREPERPGALPSPTPGSPPNPPAQRTPLWEGSQPRAALARCSEQ